MSWSWAQGPGLLPPASALPSRLGQAWVSTWVLTDLPVFGCPGAPHRPLQGEEGEGTGSEPGREGGRVGDQEPSGAGLDSLDLSVLCLT